MSTYAYETEVDTFRCTVAMYIYTLRHGLPLLRVPRFSHFGGVLGEQLAPPSDFPRLVFSDHYELTFHVYQNRQCCSVPVRRHWTENQGRHHSCNRELGSGILGAVFIIGTQLVWGQYSLIAYLCQFDR